jgi:hypothetical protein
MSDGVDPTAALLLAMCGESRLVVVAHEPHALSRAEALEVRREARALF